MIVPVEETRLDDAELTANGRPLEEEAERTLAPAGGLRRLRLGRAGFLTATVGRRRTTVGDGYVYDDYATGVELRADLGAVGPQWDLSVALFQPTRDLPRTAEGISPVVVLRADYLPSLFDHAGLFAALLRERTGGFANVFRGAIEERLVLVATGYAPGTAVHRQANQLLAATASARYCSETTLGWLGTSGTLTPWKGHRFGWTAGVLRGELREVTGRRARSTCWPTGSSCAGSSPRSAGTATCGAASRPAPPSSTSPAGRCRRWRSTARAR